MVEELFVYKMRRQEVSGCVGLVGFNVLTAEVVDVGFSAQPLLAREDHHIQPL